MVLRLGLQRLPALCSFSLTPVLSLDPAFHMYKFVTSRRIALAALRCKVERSMNRKHRGEANTNSQKTSIMNRAKAEQIRRRLSTDDDSKRGEGGGLRVNQTVFAFLSIVSVS